MSIMDPWEKAKELGATIGEGGINWTWALGFTKEKAEEFVAWLVENGFDHRGVYPPSDKKSGYDIRFR